MHPIQSMRPYPHHMIGFSGKALDTKMDVVGAVDPTLVQMDSRLVESLPEKWKVGGVRFSTNGNDMKKLPVILLEIEQFGFRDKANRKGWKWRLGSFVGGRGRLLDMTQNTRTLIKTLKEKNICNLPGCDSPAHLQCSRCKQVVYCTKEHQKKDWKEHKKHCTVANSTKCDFHTTSCMVPNFTMKCIQ